MNTTSEENEPDNKNIIPLEEEPLSMSVEKNQESNDEESSFLSRFGKAFLNFLRALLRLIITLIFIIGIVAAVYFGLPYLYQTFMAPVQQNTIKINGMEIQISAILTKQSDMDSRLSAVENTIESYSATIEKLEEIQSTIENQLQENNNQVLLELKHEVMLTRAFDMLGRARLYLAQSNFGLAKEDVQSARDLLFKLQNETNDEAMNQVVSRLDLALSNLPQFPVVAAGDLEIAWQILMTGEASVIATSTPTSAPIETFTPTPFDVPSVTPTP